MNVAKVNNNQTFRSNKHYELKLNSFGNNTNARQAYLDMNKAVYVDYVDGDISLASLLAQKLKNFWHILFHRDPLIELKAKIIEESLKESAKEKLHFNTVG